MEFVEGRVHCPGREPVLTQIRIVGLDRPALVCVIREAQVNSVEPDTSKISVGQNNRSRIGALAAVLLHQSGEPSGQPIVADWASTGARAAPMRLDPGDGPIDVTVTPRGGGAFDVDLDGKLVPVRGIERDAHRVRFLADGLQETAHVAFADDGALLVDLRGVAMCFRDTLLAAGRAGGGPADGAVLAPMHGRILAVDAKPGDQVSRGQRLVVLEAMKIEHEIAAELDGTVDDVAVSVGDQVAARSVLIRLRPAATD